MQTNNVTDVWGTAPKVNSFQDIAKLPIKTEVPPETVQENSMATRTKKDIVRTALEYSIAHPLESLVTVAKRYGIGANTLYNARFHHKKRLEKGTKRSKVQPKSTTSEATKQDVVNHPAHYKTGGIETIDFIEAKQLTYNLGNVVKYITRAGVKNKATHIEDLEKAAWYLNREIANLKGGE
jgi:hypothetical protein